MLVLQSLFQYDPLLVLKLVPALGLVMGQGLMAPGMAQGTAVAMVLVRAQEKAVVMVQERVLVMVEEMVLEMVLERAVERA